MKILRYLYAFYASLLFVLSMLPAFVLLLIGKILPTGMQQRYSNTILSWWATWWHHVVGIPVVAENLQSGWKKGTAVLVTNHTSFLDTPASYITIPHFFRTLAKRELLKLPVMGTIFTTSSIMVDRSSQESRRASFARMSRYIQGGTSILIFPEGTQNRTPETLQPFYDGAFRLAIENQVPVQPIATVNARWLMPRAEITKMKPGRIRQIYLPPVPTQGMTLDDIKSLRDQVRHQLHVVLEREDPHYHGLELVN